MTISEPLKLLDNWKIRKEYSCRDTDRNYWKNTLETGKGHCWSETELYGNKDNFISIKKMHSYS